MGLDGLPRLKDELLQAVPTFLHDVHKSRREIRPLRPDFAPYWLWQILCPSDSSRDFQNLTKTFVMLKSGQFCSLFFVTFFHFGFPLFFFQVFLTVPQLVLPVADGLRLQSEGDL